MRKVLAFVTVLVAMLFLSSCVNGETHEVSVGSTPPASISDHESEVRKAVESGAIVVDVRTVEEVQAGHYPGAINVPIEQLQQGDYAQKLPDKDATYVLYCRSGNRSAQAKALLEEDGYKNILDAGGLTDFTKTMER